MAQLELPPKEDKVCANCKHLAWMIGIGLGLRCIHKSVYQADFNRVPPTVPSSRHTCDNFETIHDELRSQGTETD
jgi:hypothetical protein